MRAKVSLDWRGMWCVASAAISSKAVVPMSVAFGSFVRIADINVFSCEGPFCSLSFESERYRPQAYHVDGKAGLVQKVKSSS